MTDNKVLYVIELEPQADPRARWYVGITSNFDRRLYQHKSGQGSKWTARNQIVDHYLIGKGDRKVVIKMEKQLTKFLMQEFGMDTTRGANYLSPTLNRFGSFDDILLPPELGRLVLDSGSADLARAAKGNIGVRFEIEDPIEFRGDEEALDWADENLPTGCEITISWPGWRDDSTTRSQ